MLPESLQVCLFIIFILSSCHFIPFSFIFDCFSISFARGEVFYSLLFYTFFFHIRLFQNFNSIFSFIGLQSYSCLETRSGDKCLSYSVIFGWENRTALEPLKDLVEVSIIESPSNEVYVNDYLSVLLIW
jgi:hypothetical protein